MPACDLGNGRGLKLSPHLLLPLGKEVSFHGAQRTLWEMETVTARNSRQSWRISFTFFILCSADMLKWAWELRLLPKDTQLELQR